MTVLAYETHENVLSHHDALELLKNFANGQGWTVLDWRKNNSSWGWTGSQYDWVSGTESFLMIQSPGYGSQVLHYRFRAEHNLIDPQHEFIWVGSPDPTHTAIDHGLPTNPESQYAWNFYHQHSFKPLDIPKIWLFGDDKFISMVAQMDSQWVNLMGFGSLELFDTSETGGYCASDVNASGYKWYNYQEWTFADRTYYNFFHENRAKSGSEVVTSCGPGTNGFVGYHDIVDFVDENPYSEVRPLFKPVISAKFDTDGLWRALGTLPVYRASHKGLQIGEKLVYGVKEYLFFPRCKINDNTRYDGIAYRIA